MLLKINSQNPEPEKINQVVEVLKGGGVIVYPTDTIYGLGCDIFNKNAVEKIYQIKKRDPKKPLSIICPNFEEISQYAIIQDYAFALMKKVLPGPFTFILKARSKTPKTILSKNKTIGIRIPDNIICLEIVKKLENPIITTSLNISGEKVMTEPSQLSKEMRNKIDLIIEAGNLWQIPSTIIDLSGNQPVLLRRGKGDTKLFQI
jgi:tRNA threonylcarbamoyl adenosine modification protein (Sua5/YciO/YrdC/YwlC family)